MAPHEIERIGTALFGERFRSALASALGVSKGAITHWLDGKPVPGPVIAALAAWKEIFETTGRRPPIAPGSINQFNPNKKEKRGRNTKMSKYSKIIE